MKKFVRLAIDIDKKNRKHCGASCPWLERNMQICSAFDPNGESLKCDKPPLEPCKRSAKCLRSEVKK